MKISPSKKITQAYIPFDVRIVPIKKTAMIRFRMDPDQEYNSFEFQVFEVEGHEFYGILALRKDGYKDFYLEKGYGLAPDDDLLTVGGKGLADRYETVFTEAFFEEEGDRLNIGFVFKDKLDRTVKFYVDEQNEEKRGHFSWLPAVGRRIIDPNALPLFFLYDFDFVTEHGTQSHLSIDNTPHKIDPYVFPKKFQSRLGVQYSTNALIINFNEKRLTHMPTLNLDKNGTGHYKGKDYRYEKVSSEGSQEPHFRLKEIKVHHDSHPTSFIFDPAFPTERDLEEAKPEYGTFTIKPTAELGEVTGSYNVTLQNDQLIIILHFKQGWRPNKEADNYPVIHSISSSSLKDWYLGYQCIQIVDLKSGKVSSEWMHLDSNRRNAH